MLFSIVIAQEGKTVIAENVWVFFPPSHENASEKSTLTKCQEKQLMGPPVGQRRGVVVLSRNQP